MNVEYICIHAAFGTIILPYELISGQFQGKSPRHVNHSIFDMAANWCMYIVMFGANFDFQIVKVVTLRDHHIEASKS